MNFIRRVFPMTTATPVVFLALPGTQVIEWTETTAGEPPVYGDSFVDYLADPTETIFARAIQILDRILDGTIPAAMTVRAVDAIVALVLNAPVYEVHYDGTEFTVTVAPPVDFVESHNWAGWPVHPYVPPPIPPLP